MLLVTSAIALVVAIASRDSPFRKGFLYVWSHVGETFGFCKGLPLTGSNFGYAVGEFTGFVSILCAFVATGMLFLVAWVLTEKSSK
jgi:hypothetical protein